MNGELLSEQRRNAPRGSALLATLLILSLITIITVAFLGSMIWEASAARRGYENVKARSLATLGMNTAVAQLRLALGPWDDPYRGFATNPPAFYWSVSPGILTRWSYASPTPLTNYPLFSSGSTNLVNLNAPQGDGSYPIAGGPAAPNISVYWANVLKDPAAAAAGADNPIIGRYAFWVDDENAKININTADGTLKYQTNSLGLGSPSEVSLQVLQADPSALAPATNIVHLARTTGFNSPKEILRAAGTTPDMYGNNVFSLTAYSRSPDLNVFGQPKMVLTPLLGTSANSVNDMTMNSITLQPSREIYPTPSQLPKYTVGTPLNVSGGAWSWHPATPSAATQQPYPLAFRGTLGNYNSGAFASLNPGDAETEYKQANYPWNNGMMLAQYLAGTNAGNQAVTWPAFPGSSPGGFLGKYTPRQIDSIVAQIASLASKEISPDIVYAVNPVDRVVGSRGLYTCTTPFLFFGWLSGEWVSGMGRVPKVASVELKFVTRGAVGAPTDTANYYPACNMDAWMEWWLPAAYLGGKNDIPIPSASGQIILGEDYDQRVLNMADLSEYYTFSPRPGAALPSTNSLDSAFPVSYWGNQLLANNQGIDFQCNPSNNNSIPAADPDQYLAAQYHNPYALETNNATYAGTGSRPAGGIPLWTPFSMTDPQTSHIAKDWQPGVLRCVRSQFGPGVLTKGMPMQVSAGTGANPTLNISGGIQVRSSVNDVAMTSDADPVPLEAIRGTGNGAQASGAGGTPYVMTGELWTDPTVSGSATKLRDRFVQEVIPVPPGFSVDIPSPNDDPSGITKYLLIKVADPLVNKLPGDWTAAGGATVTVSDNAPAHPAYWDGAGTTDATVGNANETDSSSGIGGSFHSNLKDPDSYWLPQADVPVCYLADVAGETLIPRSARCPDVGYLQYVRTGIMPDVPNPANPGLEHGTPFRLLSYAPSTETASQQTTAGGSKPYPDWAMLDLLYIPSTLAPYGGPYGYSETNGVWRGYGNAGVLANYSTGGGSTPGRINPNGAVIYTTNAFVPQPGVARTVPLQALVHGLMVNQTNNVSVTNPNPGFSGGTTVDDSTVESDANSIPVAIEAYIRANGPLRMPEEICNVPAVAALRPAVNATRNDLVRQIVGNLTTQSNTFSVWVAGESITKSKGNTGGLGATDPAWGLYQSGDQVSARVRYHFVVERYLDPGADGIYGNSANAGPDGIVGTYDDPVDPINHPFQPRYLYRVVAAEEIR